MPTVSLRIPQIGEGLQEARLVAVLKNPGDYVRRDEAIYQMETDKAVMDVESPYEGVLTQWVAAVDSIIPIGGEVARMEVADGVEENPAPHGAPVDAVEAITPPPAPESALGFRDADASPETAAEVSAPVTASAGNMVGVRIPQIGEGLQEARLVATLKNPGDHVRRDEAIYQMETDKAVMDVESPYEGILLEWLAAVDTVLPIGAEVARMQVEGAIEEVPVHGAPSSAAEPVAQLASSSSAAAEPSTVGSVRNEFVAPRVRAYAREKGLSDDVLGRVPTASGRLMESDIDAFLAGGAPAPVAAPPVSEPPVEQPPIIQPQDEAPQLPIAAPPIAPPPIPQAAPTPAVVEAKPAGPSPGGPYQEVAMGSKQRLLSSRLMRAGQLVVPGTMTVCMNWESMENLRARYKMRGGDFQPSAFTMFAFACVRALAEFPAFRTSLRGDETLRTYEHVNLGIAVALPGDELVIAVVDKAETLSWRDFAQKMREQIELARDGKDQAHEGVTVSLTNMAHNGIRDAVAVVVPPSVATIFLGEAYNGLAPNTMELKLQRCANLGITFDHRLINGVGAANFQNKIKANVEDIGALIHLE